MNTTKIAILASMLALVLLPLRGLAESPTQAMQDNAIKLFDSLTPEQKKQALLPYDSPEKKSEVFPGGKRPGIQIKTLNDDQQKMALELLTAFTSDAGRKTAIAITEQKPDNPARFPRFWTILSLLLRRSRAERRTRGASPTSSHARSCRG